MDRKIQLINCQELNSPALQDENPSSPFTKESKAKEIILADGMLYIAIECSPMIVLSKWSSLEVLGYFNTGSVIQFLIEAKKNIITVSK